MPVTHPGAVPAPSNDPQQAASQRLQSTMAAVRLSVRWLGVRKTLTTEQKAEAAETFEAEGQYLSAAKKLLDTRHPAFKAVTAVKNQAVSYWRGMSVPYPEPGLRLIRRDQIETFDQHLRDLSQELVQAVAALSQHYGELKRAAQDRLGRLYNPSDYPSSLRGLFALEWDFPSVEPPNYLRQVNPELYEQECRRIQARFEEAVKLAEEAFTTEFAKVVAHLTERLTGAGEDGKPKVFRDSAVTNLREFFDRFRQLNIHSSEQLDALVETAQQAVRGVTPQSLRDSETMRQRINAQLTQVQTQLDALLVDRPRRRILRSAANASGEAA